MPHLLRSVHRSSYYAAEPSPMLVRRDEGSGPKNSVIVLFLVILAVVIAFSVGVILLRKITSGVQKKMFKARGQGHHLRGGSLRRYPRPGTAASRSTIVTPEPRSDWRTASDLPALQSPYSARSDWRTASNLTTPQSTYSASAVYTQAGHTYKPPHPAYQSDTFEQIPLHSRPSSPFVVESLPAAGTHPRGNWV